MVIRRRVATRTWQRHIANHERPVHDPQFDYQPRLRLTGFNDEEHPPHEGGSSWIHHTTNRVAVIP